MKKFFLTACLMLTSVHLMAQTHYLYVAGGREADAGSTGITANDTLALVNSGADIDFINVLVADVDVAAKTVGNWRIAGVLPARHPEITEPNNVLHWSYLADNLNVYNNRLYVGPATWNGTDTQLVTADFIAYADIKLDGTLGAFSTSARFPTTASTNQRISATEIVEISGQAYIYIIAGNHDEDGQSSRILYAPISATTGAIGAWVISTTPNPVPDWFTGAVAHAGRLVHVGGNLRGTRSVDHAPISATGDITTAFTNLVYDATTGNRWDYGVTKTVSGGNTFLHIIAGTDGTTRDQVHYSQLDNASGIPGAFTLDSNPLPGVRRRMTATGAADMIVVPGGSTTTSYAAGTSTVFIGTVASNGAVTWTTSPTPMSSNGVNAQARSFHGSVLAPVPNPPASVHNWTMY